MQEDKEGIFDTCDTVKMCLKVFEGMISTLTVCEDNMKAAAGKGFINATDLADYLVKKGLPFRTAYKISGEIVAQCIKENKILETLTLEEYKKHSDLFENDLFHEISLETCVAKRISKGGTSVKSVEEQIEAVKEKIK
jgi:argininosuccinate lyase